MTSLKDLFGNLFGGPGKDGELEAEQDSARDASVVQDFGIPYKKGDFIGQKYEVYGVLGQGGFGVVYLVYSHDTGSARALKTFRDEHLKDSEKRGLFYKEAQIWVNLDAHPYLVRAYSVDEISGRLYIEMEYIAPNDSKLNTLEGYLQCRPPDLAQSLRWAIQFCYGMEYAYSKGIRCHRDIKPANIMISYDKTVKISDFGLAGILGLSRGMYGINLNIRHGRIGFGLLEGAGGTPTHMPPEQFSNSAECDQRSDIYSFGVVLYQMATGGKYPFPPPVLKDNSTEEKRRFWLEMERLHSKSLVPSIDSPLFPIIQHCLEKEPGKRFQTFKELRSELEPLLKQKTGETIKVPDPPILKAWEWNSKGYSLNSLGRHNDAIPCFDRAIEIDSQFATAWVNKGRSLNKLNRFDEANSCLDKAIEINPQEPLAYNEKGISIGSMSDPLAAIWLFDKAIEIDPECSVAWINKGICLANLPHFDIRRCEFDIGRYEEAITCYDKAIELEPQNTDAWYNRGNALHRMQRFDEAIECYDKLLEIDPFDSDVWYDKGRSLEQLGRYDEAIGCLDKAIQLGSQYSSHILIHRMLLERYRRQGLGERRQVNEMDVWDTLRDFSPDNFNEVREILKLETDDVEAMVARGVFLCLLDWVEDGFFSEDDLACMRKIQTDTCRGTIGYTHALPGRLFVEIGNSTYYGEREIAASTCYNNGLEKQRDGDKRDAIRYYMAALLLFPLHAKAWYQMGIAFGELGTIESLKKSITCFDYVLKLEPDAMDAMPSKGFVLVLMGRRKEGAQWIERVLDIQPDYPLALRYKKMLTSLRYRLMGNISMRLEQLSDKLKSS